MAEDSERGAGVVRPRHARVVPVLSSLTVLCVLAIPVAYFVWANRLPAAEADDRVLPHPNGFDACVAAASSFEPSPRGSPLASLLRADPEVLRPLVRRDRRGLDQVRRAFALPYVTPALRDLSEPYPYLARYREAARRFGAESRIARADGRFREALMSSLDAIELGSRCGRGAGLVHSLAGAACAAIGIGQAEPCVGHLSASDARSAGRRLGRINAEFPPFADAVREERRMVLATLRGVFSGEVPLEEAMEEGYPDGDIPLERRVSFFWYPKSWAYSSLDRSFTTLAGEAGKPFPVRQRVRLPRGPVGSVLTFDAVFIPMAERCGLGLTEKQAERDLLRLELALREYHESHRAYPRQLTDLVPSVLSTVPADPFSNRAMRYQPEGDHYLLYSVGQDGIDNGGSPVPKNKRLEWDGKGDLVAGRLYLPEAPSSGARSPEGNAAAPRSV